MALSDVYSALSAFCRGREERTLEEDLEAGGVSLAAPAIEALLAVEVALDVGCRCGGGAVIVTFKKL